MSRCIKDVDALIQELEYAKSRGENLSPRRLTANATIDFCIDVINHMAEEESVEEE